MVKTFLSLAFHCSYTNDVEEQLLVQNCIDFTNEQIEVFLTSKFVATAT